MPRLQAFARARQVRSILPSLPAVTCSVQTTFLTGQSPQGHGVVGNGWYFRDTAEIRFWQQADALVQAPRIWGLARERDPAFTCANMFWWFAMYSGADFTVTPRPMYPADGRKVPDVWTHPPSLRDDLQREIGRFPLFQFWGPMAGIESTRWIAEATKRVVQRHDPTLTLAYLPHLDYALQKLGPDDPRVEAELRQLDDVAGDLIDFLHEQDRAVLLLSEYGITPVNRPVHLNRVLRSHGLLSVRMELGRERLDAGASRAFAVADHQVAHVYIRDGQDIDAVEQIVAATPGVGRTFRGAARGEIGLDHPRSGEVICLAQPEAWFTYYFWNEDALAPDYARTVDIHRKPGYDPVELFLDPGLRLSTARIALKIARRKMGFRNLLDVIPLDASLVRGSHGLPVVGEEGPLLLGDLAGVPPQVKAEEVMGVMLEQIFS